MPDVPTFSVDDGFSYAVPDHLDIGVGSRVRMRMSGRRTKGFVTAILAMPSERELLPLDGVVGDLRAYDDAHLDFLRWTARHYVAPLSVVLARTIPPNIPRAGNLAAASSSSGGPGHTLTQVIGAPPYADTIREVVAVASATAHSTMVIVPTADEATEIASLITIAGLRVVLAHSGLPANDVTAAWSAANTERVCLVGTREIALWPVARLGAVVVVEDARRVMKSPATPTIGVREVAIERARRASIPITFCGPVPSLEVAALSPGLVEPEGRHWPQVEIADRGDEPPTASPVLERTRIAIASTVKGGGSVFVLVPRRGYAAVEVCAACGALRKCADCETASTGDARCRRCDATPGACTQCGADRWRTLGAGRGVVIEDLARSVGDAVGDASSDRSVVVGTERDLVGVRNRDLTVAVDVDGMAFAPHYRAAEDALRLLARLAQATGPKRGGRCLLQTSDPSQPVIEALRTGTSAALIEHELGVRRRSGFPPSGQLIALEVTGPAQAPSLGALEGKATIRGPARQGDGWRWLLSGKELDGARVALRSLVGDWRAAGSRVRVDVDPYDL